MKTRVVLFEDQFLADMSPVTLTRPAFDATCACLTLWDVAAATGAEVSWLVRPHLAKLAACRFSAAVAFRGGARVPAGTSAADTRRPAVQTNGRPAAASSAMRGT